MTQQSFKFSDNRSERFVLVPFCVLSQSFHAEGLVKYEWKGVIKPIVQILMDHDVNIIQMPCMETIFNGGPATGLNRKPKGMKHYDVPEFQDACKTEAKKVLEQVKGIIQSGYTVSAILGMEYSPSCAVNIQYPPKKGELNRGVYIRELAKLLKEENLNIPMLGINRKAINPTLKRLESILLT